MVRLRIGVLASLLSVALALPGAAGAAKPIIERVPIEDIGVLDEFLTDACGFDIWLDAVGHITFRVWEDSAGNPVRELNNFGVRLTFSSETSSVFAQDVGVDRVTYNADGTILQVVIGSVQSFTAPGQGRVYANVGRVVLLFTFDPDTEEFVGEVLSASGQHGDDQVAVLCDVLG